MIIISITSVFLPSGALLGTGPLKRPFGKYSTVI